MEENSAGINIEPTPKFGRKKEIVFILLAIFISLIAALLAGELFLRIAHFPGIEFNNIKYDSLVGYGLYPDSKIIYSNNGVLISRQVNSSGFLDAEHNSTKADGLYRIGFFGDSFTEARQVPLDKTFFRLIQNQLDNKKYEIFSFGVSGYGTLQSYLTSQSWAEKTGLDLIVYVFCENDPGDEIREIKQMQEIPYPVLTKDGLTIDNSFLKSSLYLSKQKPIMKLLKFISSHSLLTSTLIKRAQLLKNQGIKLEVKPEEIAMDTKADNNKKIPNQNDLPSSWPSEYRDQAKRLEEAVILKWQGDAEALGKKFIIMYIPRQGQMNKEVINQDSWKYWLEDFSKKNNIEFIDPTAELVLAETGGQAMFSDHFTEAGHAAFAEVFLNWFIQKINN
jgi:hypothetical protein